jgi:hypothetical protein
MDVKIGKKMQDMSCGFDQNCHQKTPQTNNALQVKLQKWVSTDSQHSVPLRWNFVTANPNPEMDYHPLSSIHDGLFNILTAILSGGCVGTTIHENPKILTVFQIVSNTV